MSFKDLLTLQRRRAAADAQASATTSSSPRTRSTSRPTSRACSTRPATTLLCLAIGYPFAYFMARAQAHACSRRC
ncbi:MAG: hypothetical protein MZW92_30495 [Comamonadaceae bacterium]|nr:hypothetical protein [Comamonadaceae bacterium]